MYQLVKYIICYCRHPVDDVDVTRGIAYLGQCGQKYAVSVTKYQSLSSVAGTMCHEIGHK